MPHDVFISHSARDKSYADAVCAKLESQSIRCWIAPRDIRPGMDWGAAIIEAIDGARVMLLVFSSHANGSPQIKREVERAVNRELIVVPVRVEDVKPTGNLEYFLGTPHWLDAITPPFERHLDYIADSVKFWLERIHSERTTYEAPPPPKPARDLPRAAASPDAITSTRSRPKWIVLMIVVLAIALLGTAAIFGARHYAAQQELAREQAAQQAAAAQEQRDREAEQQREKEAEQTRQRAAAEAEEHKRAEAIKAQKDAERKAALAEKQRATAEAKARAPATADAELRSKEESARELKRVNDYRKSAAQGDATAEIALGGMYESGELPKDYDEALRWYRKAAEQGNALGEFHVGVMYQIGRGVPQDYPEALQWFRKAADQNNIRAEKAVGFIYENGWGGVPRDLTEAVKWYERAAAQGDEDAKQSLKELHATP